MVVMEREDYIDKANNLLPQPAYRTIDREPTEKLKAKHITLLKENKKRNWIRRPHLKEHVSQRCTSPSFMDFKDP